jgi:hypothetical protein
VIFIICYTELEIRVSSFPTIFFFALRRRRPIILGFSSRSFFDRRTAPALRADPQPPSHFLLIARISSGSRAFLLDCHCHVRHERRRHRVTSIGHHRGFLPSSGSGFAVDLFIWIERRCFSYRSNRVIERIAGTSASSSGSILLRI